METKSVILGLFVALTAMFASCSDDDGNGNGNGFSKDKAEQLLKDKYGTDRIEWRKDGKYDVAQLYVPVSRAADVDTVNVWFEGAFIRLAEEEIGFKKLPQAVQDEFNRTKDAQGNFYKDETIWERDDAAKLEREGVVVYKIEVEAVKNDEERALYYNDKGALIKDVSDEEERPLEIPAKISEWVTKNYKDAVIVDYEAEEEDGTMEYELDLLKGNVTIELTLDKDLKIIEEEYEYKKIDDIEDVKVRDAIKDKIEGNTFGLTVDDLDKIEMEVEKDGKKVYEVQFEKGDNEYELTIEELAGDLQVGEIVED